jgi:hypothetical protein
MKRVITFIIFLVFQSNLFAQESFDVLVRNKNFHPTIKKLALEDLTSETKFEGKYFKIVVGASEEAVSFSSDDDLKLKAATVYYHLTKARRYFIEEVKSDYVASLPQLTVRLEMTRDFHELGHFANENVAPQYNNALSVPGGSNIRTGEKWENEIWFRPDQRVHIEDLGSNGLPKDFVAIFQTFRQQTHTTSFQRFLSQLLTNSLQWNNSAPLASIFRLAGASIVMEAVFQYQIPLAKALSRKTYWLDTALIPEVIYHEYSHIALSDHLKLLVSYPVNEGLADIFATQISGHSKIATNIKKYNTYEGKKAKNKKIYSTEFETKSFANTDFVLSILYHLKEIVGEEKFNAFIYRLSTKVNTSSYIKEDLVQGILETCQEMCSKPFTDRLKIQTYLHQRGI